MLKFASSVFLRPFSLFCWQGYKNIFTLECKVT